MPKVGIVGSGMAGLTAAIYTARADLEPWVWEGNEPGGQLTLTSVVENYPGFPDGIDGFELVTRLKTQAERFGARFLSREVTELRRLGERFELVDSSGETTAVDAVIVASGARARYLGLPKEQELVGRGVSTCATCDGAFFRGQDVIVVGGGDSAIEEALYLSRLVRKVTVVHRRDQLRATKIMQDRARTRPNIEFLWNSVVVELHEGDGGLAGVTVEHVQTKERTRLAATGMFLAIGHIPNTDFVRGVLELDELGYIKAHGTETDVPGIFVAGDCADREYQQAVTAAGSGCQAALEVEAYLESRGL
jgi:thioredoxin reductase (NADPH)